MDSTPNAIAIGTTVSKRIIYKALRHPVIARGKLLARGINRVYLWSNDWAARAIG
jgi:hypothetical protein